MTELGIAGIWNFTGLDIDHDPSRVAVENVHLGDSLMFLNYRVCQLSEQGVSVNENLNREDGEN